MHETSRLITGFDRDGMEVQLAIHQDLTSFSLVT